MNSLYNEKMEALISAALMDGVLTEKEKQILFKKAQEQGIDLDEFEMVLDARLVELQKAEQEKAEKKAAEKSAAPKSQRATDVRKCPVCGCVVPAFTACCPDCGYNFSGFETTTAAKELEKKINQVYVEAEDQKKALRAERQRISAQIEDACTEVRKAYQTREEKIKSQNQSKGLMELLLGNSGTNELKENKRAMEKELARVSMPLTQIDQQLDTFDSQLARRVKSVVNAFPIPSNKADLFEFLVSMRERGYTQKYNEALTKAETLFATEPLFAQFIQERKDVNQQRKAYLLVIDVKISKLRSLLAQQEKEYEQVYDREERVPFLITFIALFIIAADIVTFASILDWDWLGILLINIPIVLVVGAVWFGLMGSLYNESGFRKHTGSERLKLAIDKTKKEIEAAQQERKKLI